MPSDRREFLKVSASAGVALGFASRPGRALAHSNDAVLEALLQSHCETFLARSPEEATAANFDIGQNAHLRARLDDRSLAARERDRRAVKDALAQLRAVPVQGLSERAALDRDVALYVYETLDRLLGFYGYADLNLRPSPYVVSQMNGAYYWLPDFIGGRHPITDGADAEAYFDRLSGLAIALDQESARIRHDAAIGVVPPEFVIEKTVAQIKNLRDGPPLASALFAPAIARMQALDRRGDAEWATHIFRHSVGCRMSICRI